MFSIFWNKGFNKISRRYINDPPRVLPLAQTPRARLPRPLHRNIQSIISLGNI